MKSKDSAVRIKSSTAAVAVKHELKKKLKALLKNQKSLENEIKRCKWDIVDADRISKEEAKFDTGNYGKFGSGHRCGSCQNYLDNYEGYTWFKGTGRCSKVRVEPKPGNRCALYHDGRWAAP